MFEKITDFGDNCVSSAPDILTGTAQANKEIFDRVAKDVIAPAFNKLVGDLALESAPEHIGAEGGTLKALLDGLKQNLSDVTGTIDTKVADAIAKVVANAPEDLDTLKELSDWIKSHTNSAAEMNSAIAAIRTLLAGKVDKEEGKGLSEENFTKAEQKKLAGIEVGANYTNIEVLDGSNCSYQGSEIYFYFDRGGKVEDDFIYINALTEEDCKKLDSLDDNLAEKVDKEEGKGLSEVDFTKEKEEELKRLAEGWTLIKSDTLTEDAGVLTIDFGEQYKEVYVRMIVPTMISDAMPTVPAGRVYVYANEYNEENVIFKENSALFTDTTGEALNLNYRIRMVDKYCNVQRQHSFGERQANASATANSTISGFTDIGQGYLEALVFTFSPTTRVFPTGSYFEIWGVRA